VIYLKTSPKGIDIRIQSMQQYLYDKLVSIYSCEINAYGRVYKEKNDNSIKPLYYVGNGNYKELLINNKIKGLHFFFVENEESDIISRTCKRSNEIDLIVIINNLKSIKSNISHYPDEEIVLDVLDYTKTFINSNKLTKGEKALDGFDISELKFIYPFFVFKITGTINNY